MKNKLSFLLLILIFINMNLQGQGRRVNVEFFPTNSENQSNAPNFDIIDFIELVPIVLDIGESTYELWKVYKDNTREELTFEEYQNVSLIQGSGEDFDENNMSLVELVYRIAKVDNNYFLKKITTAYLKTMQNLWTSVLLSTYNKRSNDYSSQFYLNGIKYNSNIKLTRYARSANYNNYIELSNFELTPEIDNPYSVISFPPSDAVVYLYLTFDDQSTQDLIKYPALKMNWNNLNNGQNRIHQLVKSIPDFLSANLIPKITMLIYARNRLVFNKEFFVKRVDYSGGYSNPYPAIPQLSLKENDYSLELSWQNDPNANYYMVYRSDNSNINFDTDLLTTVNQTLFLDENIEPSIRYYYRVKPISTNQIVGNSSQVISGVAKAKYNIAFFNLGDNRQNAGEFFNIDGSVTTIVNNLPVENPNIKGKINEVDFEFEEIQINTGNNFKYNDLEVPIVPGEYTYDISVSKNGISQNKDFTKIVEFEEIKHDLGITSFSAGTELRIPGDVINTTTIVTNYGELQQDYILKVMLKNESNTTIVENFLSKSIPVGTSQNSSIDLTIPTNISSGYYQVFAEILTDIDRDKTNDSESKTIFIDNNYVSFNAESQYRLTWKQYNDKLGQTISIDGRSVTITSVNEDYARFTAGNQTGIQLETDEYWESDANDFFIFLEDIFYVDDTTFTVEIRAGAKNTAISFTSKQFAPIKNQEFDLIYTKPSNITLQGSSDFSFDIDSDIMNAWNHELLVEGNKYTKKMKVPYNKSNSRSHISYLKLVEIDSDYWWITKVKITPIKIHETKIYDISYENLYAGVNQGTGDIIGDRLVFSGKIKNDGEFSENVPVRLSVKQNSDEVWYYNQEINVPKDEGKSFSLVFPSLGLDVGEYSVDILSKTPEDINNSDNQYQTAINFVDKIPLNILLSSNKNNYSIGDTIEVFAEVKANEVNIQNALVYLNSFTPEGNIFSNRMIYDSDTKLYSYKIYCGIGGNYYLDVEANLRRFETGFDSTMISSPVQLYFERLSEDLYTNENGLVGIKISPVGGLYSAALDLIDNNSLLQFENVYEGNVVNNYGNHNTNLLSTNSGNRQIIGLTKNNRLLEPSFINHDEILVVSEFVNLKEGSGSFEFDNVGLFDINGNEIPNYYSNMNYSIAKSNSTIKTAISEDYYGIGDTVVVTSSLFNARNIKAADVSFSYNNQILKYLSTNFDSSFSNYGDMNFISTANSDNDQLNVGISLVGQESSISNKTLTLFSSYFEVIGNGNLILEDLSGSVVPFYINSEYADNIFLENNGKFLGISDSVILSISSDNEFVQKDSIFSCTINLNRIDDLHSIALDINYEPNELEFIDITELNFLNNNGNDETSFLYKNDTVNNKIIIGLTRLNESSGVTSNNLSKLIEVKFKKLTLDTNFISLSNTSLINLFQNSIFHLVNNLTLNPLISIPGKPVLISPQNQETLTSLPINFSWSATEFTESYNLQISNENTFIQLIVDTLLSENSFSSNTFENNINYFWRVKSLNQNGESSWSDIFSFSIINENFSSLIHLSTNWNIISVPLKLEDMSSSSIFPAATSNVFGFNNGYISTDTLENGKGYWIRYPNDEIIEIEGTSASDTIEVKSGWNMIGIGKDTVNITGVVSIPENIVVSNYFGFNNGYQSSTELIPGKGYWVKSNSDGKLILITGTQNEKSILKNDNENVITLLITDKNNQIRELYYSKNGNYKGYELPPIPPNSIIDARYANNYNTTTENNTIKLNGAEYPVSIKVVGGDIKLNSKLLMNGDQIEITEGENTINVEYVEIPLNFELMQNYPNPFNPSTIIKYAIPNVIASDGGAKQSIVVTLKVYDILGNEVTTLVNEQKEPGYHEAKFNAKNLSSGMYIYRITADKFSEVKKMLLVK